MSGYPSRMRQWNPGRVRALLVILLALTLLVPAASVYAQDTPPAEPAPADAAAPAPEAQTQPPQPPTTSRPVGKLCVVGTVIDFEEYPMPGPDPDNEDLFWNITMTPGDIVVEVDEDGYFEFGPEYFAMPGDFTFTINIAGTVWTPVEPYEESVDVSVDYHKSCQVIRFKLVTLVPVDVIKIDDTHNLLDDWFMQAKPASDNWFWGPAADLEQMEGYTGDTEEGYPPGTVNMILTPGLWTVSEHGPSGVSYTPVIPTSGTQDVKVACTAPDFPYGTCDTITIRFKNLIAEKACLKVLKGDVAPEGAPTGSFGLPGWKFTVTKLNGTVVASGVTDSQGYARFPNLPFGWYIVTEEMKSGWTPAADEYVAKYVNLAKGSTDDCDDEEVVIVEFYNEQYRGYTIIGRKVDTNGLEGLPNWKVTITPLDKGGWPNLSVDVDEASLPIERDTYTINEDGGVDVWTNSNGDFKFKFSDAVENGDLGSVSDYRLASARYQVCENLDDYPGWLPHTPECYNITLPSAPGSVPVKVPVFENQQVGHWESVVYGRPSSSSSSHGCAYTHTVMPGESLYGIGAAYGVSPSAMLAANPWVYSRPHYYVYPGDQVCIP